MWNLKEIDSQILWAQIELCTIHAKAFTAGFHFYVDTSKESDTEEKDKEEKEEANLETSHLKYSATRTEPEKKQTKLI